MDLWARTGNDAILPPRYNRQPGSPKNKKVKDASEKATDRTKLGKIQNSLRCSNCGTLGHNIKTCHRHLPPKENISKKKRNLNSGDGTSSTPHAKGTKKPPLTKDEKRAKLKKKAEKLKEKVAAKTVAKATTKSSTASTTTQFASAKNKGAASTKSSAPTRSSKRIRGGDKQAGK
ncbi:hypothetical protein ACLB2K_040663 [Fragaria x ananassa]